MRVNGLKTRNTPTARNQAKSVREKKFYCALCNYAAPSSDKLARHHDTDKHKFAVIKAKKADAKAAGSSS